MKAASLNPPYGTLIAVAAAHPELGKNIETRGPTWRFAHRGPIAIHQTAGLGEMFTSEAELWALCQQEPFRTALAAVGITRVEQLPRGAIVAVADLVDCKPTDDPAARFNRSNGWSMVVRGTTYRWPLTATERAFGNYAPGRKALLLANIRALPEPIPARGMQGLWEWDAPAELVQP